MKHLFNILLFISISLLASCGGGSGPTQPQGSVDVDGYIENQAIVWNHYLPDLINKAFATDYVSTRSTLTVTNPIRLPDVSLSSGIDVSGDVVNSTPAPLNGYTLDIYIEDETYLTPEVWTCNVCYPNSNNGQQCQGTNETIGDKLFEPDNVTIADVPTCQAGLGNQTLCVSDFPAGVDCGATPTYSNIYTDPGNGLYPIEAGINVAALSNLLSTFNVSNSGWLTGTDKYARFEVYNQNQVLVVRKDYVFNVIP